MTSKSSSIHTQQILAKREMVSTMEPLKVKGLAMRFGLTQAQVRALLMKHGRNWIEFAHAARILRAQ